MTVYVESSVLVRIVAGQERPLRGYESLVAPVSSALIEIETPRAIDRLRRAGDLDEKAAAAASARGRDALRTFRLMEINPAVRLRAGGPFAVPVRSLDAIHVASALLWRESHPDEELLMATHDERVAAAARAHGLPVVGWSESRSS